MRLLRTGGGAGGAGPAYSPLLSAHQLGLTREKLVQINRTQPAVLLSEQQRADAADADADAADAAVGPPSHYPLALALKPMSIGRFNFDATMEEAMGKMAQIATEADTDSIREMFTDTSPLLLAVTMVVSMLHMALDVLAFKSDVDFWRAQRTMRGLSQRALWMDLFCQAVIAVYLHEESSSLLVTVPAVFQIFIQLWKIWKAWRMGDGGGGDTDPGAATAPAAAASKNPAPAPAPAPLADETKQFDAMAVSYMCWVLLAPFAGWFAFTLLYHEHVSWYRWGLGCLTGGVYGFGFVMMSPQLFINYKLRSVAHLPWRVLVYRACNTFIDDLFAFVIRMPTMHRLSCFRDDIIFFVYLYQRRIYPVDFSRRTTVEGVEGERAKQD